MQHFDHFWQMLVRWTERWTIRGMMVGLAVISVLAVLLLSASALLSNQSMVQYQQELLEEALPISEANRRMAVTVTRIWDRQNALMRCTSSSEIEQLLYRQSTLERDYIVARMALDHLVDRSPETQSLLETMDADNDRYRDLDRMLVQYHLRRVEYLSRLQERVVAVTRLVGAISTSLDALVGHVRLEEARMRRALRHELSIMSGQTGIGTGDPAVLLGRMQEILLGDWATFRDTAIRMRESMLLLTLTSQRLLTERQPDRVVDLRGNHLEQTLASVTQLMSVLQQSLDAIAVRVPQFQPYAVLRPLVLQTAGQIVQLPALLVEGEDAFVALLLATLQHEQQIGVRRAGMQEIMENLLQHVARIDSPAGAMRQAIVRDTEQLVATSQWLVISITVLMVAITGGMTLFFLRWLLRRSQRIVDHLHVFTTGQYRQTIPLEHRQGQDELDQIAAKVNTLASALQATEEENLHAQMSRIAISALLETSLAPLSLHEYLKVALQIILSIPWMKLRQHGAVFLRSPQTGEMELAVAYGFSDACIYPCREVWTQRYVMFIPGAPAGGQAGDHAGGHYCVPILSADAALGVVLLDLAPGNEPNNERESFLTTLSYTLAGVIDRKLFEDQICHLAHHDTLTGLPNRSQFQDHLRMGLARASRSQTCLAVMLLDLDRFKQVNDTHGHAAGDMVLREVARRVKGCLRSSDLLARLGGDEFVVVLAEITQPEDAGLVADKIVRLVAQPFVLAEGSCDIGVSIGISVYPWHGSDVDALVMRADQAMYGVKEQGRNGFRFFHDAASGSEPAGSMACERGDAAVVIQETGEGTG
jgi:diguanylate cyclase (GGDEF)-like protein